MNTGIQLQVHSISRSNEQTPALTFQFHLGTATNMQNKHDGKLWRNIPKILNFSPEIKISLQCMSCVSALLEFKKSDSIGRLIISVYSRKHPIPVLGYLRSVQGRQRYHLSSDTLSIQWTELTETWKEDFAEVW
jgi:hypothetical protein